jgi:hypothetical protein
MTLYPGEIRTWDFCSRGGCDVHCATQPVLKEMSIYVFYLRIALTACCHFWRQFRTRVTRWVLWKIAQNVAQYIFLAQSPFVEPQFVEPQFVELGLTTFRRTPVRRTFLTSNFYNIEPHFIDFLQHRPPIFSSNSSLFQSVKLFFFVELFFRQTFYFRPLFEG